MRFVPSPALHRETLRRVVIVGIGALGTGLALQGTLSVVRWTLHEHGGADANGQFQAAWTVGVGYLTVVLSSLGNFVFPRYAAAASATELEAEVKQASQFIMRFAPPVILIGIAFREPAIHVMFSGEFAIGAQVLGFQMAGDLAKCLAHVQAGPLLYRGHLRAFLFTELLGASLLAGLCMVLVPRYGTLATGYSYAIAYAMYSLATTWVVEQTCGIRTRRRHVLLAIAFCAVATAMVVVTSTWPWTNIVVACIGFAWALAAGLYTALMRRVGRLRGA